MLADSKPQYKNRFWKNIALGNGIKQNISEVSSVGNLGWTAVLPN